MSARKIVTIVVAICAILLALPLSLQHLFTAWTDQWLTRYTPFSQPAKATSPNQEDWLLTSEDFTPNVYQSNPYVANGYFGQSLPAEGSGYWVQRNLSAHPEDFSVNGISASHLLSGCLVMEYARLAVGRATSHLWDRVWILEFAK